MEKQVSWIGDNNWASHMGNYEMYKCSECEYPASYRNLTRCCPNCGTLLQQWKDINDWRKQPWAM